MKRIIQDMLFFILVLLFLPFYIKRKKGFKKSFIKRLGILSKEEREVLSRKKKPLWIHAASLGEVLALKPLVKKIISEFGSERVILSCITQTGFKIAKLEFGDVFFLPLDFSFLIKKYINLIKPVCFIAFETEIWPQLFSTLHQENIPIVIVNGRISDRAFKNYRRFKFFFKRVLRKVSLFLMQSELYKQRIIELGADSEKVQVLGNLKYEASQIPLNKKENEFYESLKEKFKDKKIILGASTHRGEEIVLLEVFKRLIKEFKDLILFICPRHPERRNEIKELIKREGFTCTFLSRDSNFMVSASNIIIVDLIGVLRPLYKLSYISFVGGSLIKFGGHNILEPAYFAKSIITGPFYDNFKDIVTDFKESKAIIIVKDKEELFSSIKKLLEDKVFYLDISKRAKSILEKNKDLSLIYLKKIKECLREELKI